MPIAPSTMQCNLRRQCAPTQNILRIAARTMPCTGWVIIYDDQCVLWCKCKSPFEGKFKPRSLIDAFCQQRHGQQKPLCRTVYSLLPHLSCLSYIYHRCCIFIYFCCLLKCLWLPPTCSMSSQWCFWIVPDRVRSTFWETPIAGLKSQSPISRSSIKLDWITTLAWPPRSGVCVGKSASWRCKDWEGHSMDLSLLSRGVQRELSQRRSLACPERTATRGFRMDSCNNNNNKKRLNNK